MFRASRNPCPGQHSRRSQTRFITYAIKRVPTRIDVKTEPVALKQEHVDVLDTIKVLYDNISKRHSVYYYLLISKKMWLLYLFITALLSVGTTFLVMNTSSKEWAHKAMEYDAKKILYLETILADYIDGEFCIEQYHSQQTEHLVYAAVCRFAGSKDLEVYNIHMKDGKVVEVTRRYKDPKKKKKDDPEFVWNEVKPIMD